MGSPSKQLPKIPQEPSIEMVTQDASKAQGSKYFQIYTRMDSKKVLDLAEDYSFILWDSNGKDSQMWFWDRHFLRNKSCPDRVADLHGEQYKSKSWGQVQMSKTNHGLLNQHFQFKGEEIICKGFQREAKDNFRLDAYESRTKNGTKVGINKKKRKNYENQRWNIKYPTKCPKETEEQQQEEKQQKPTKGNETKCGTKETEEQKQEEKQQNLTKGNETKCGTKEPPKCLARPTKGVETEEQQLEEKQQNPNKGNETKCGTKEPPKCLARPTKGDETKKQQ